MDAHQSRFGEEARLSYSGRALFAGWAGWRTRITTTVLRVSRGEIEQMTSGCGGHPRLPARACRPQHRYRQGGAREAAAIVRIGGIIRKATFSIRKPCAILFSCASGQRPSQPGARPFPHLPAGRGHAARGRAAAPSRARGRRCRGVAAAGRADQARVARRGQPPDRDRRRPIAASRSGCLRPIAG